MPQLKELHSVEELASVWETSKQKPVFLFKQSTTCPVSAEAFSEYNSFLESLSSDIGSYFVKVRETREVSNKIAEETHVQHQSPQVLLMKDGEVLWHTSHANITVESLEEALEQFGNQ